jgi:hypothetical protein
MAIPAADQGRQGAIADWLAARQAQLGAREVDDILRAVDHLNLTTQWVQSRPRMRSLRR